jgi:hypothetical protein
MLDALQPLPLVATVHAQRHPDHSDLVTVAVDHEFPTLGWTGPVFARVDSGDPATVVFQGLATRPDFGGAMVVEGRTEFMVRSAEAQRIVVKYGEGQEKIAEVEAAPALPSLIGKRLEVLREGQAATGDYDENRVRIWTDDNSIIVDRKFG